MISFGNVIHVSLLTGALPKENIALIFHRKVLQTILKEINFVSIIFCMFSFFLSIQSSCFLIDFIKYNILC